MKRYTTNIPRYIAEAKDGFFFDNDGKACLISITQPGEPTADIKDGWASILRIAFWDVTKRLEQGFILAGQPDDVIEPITDEQAKEIADFIKAHSEESIIVHCQAGISRSAAVVRLLNELGWDMHSYRVEDLKGYNVVVYNKVKRHFPELLPLGAE